MIFLFCFAGFVLCYFSFVCCLDEVSYTSRCGTYGWMMPDLYSSGFLCVSSHYLVLPRVSSLVVQGLGFSAPTPKAQGLISGQEGRFHKCFVIALNEIKTNIQKQETKDEPETNGSYKIKQIIIKIMEYTHIHIHPLAKSKQSNKNNTID